MGTKFDIKLVRTDNDGGTIETPTLGVFQFEWDYSKSCWVVKVDSARPDLDVTAKTTKTLVKKLARKFGVTGTAYGVDRRRGDGGRYLKGLGVFQLGK